MAQYMLSVIHAEEGPDWTGEVDVQELFAKVDAFNKELQESGSWVFAGGLEPRPARLAWTPPARMCW
jgi:hypothetical protein